MVSPTTSTEPGAAGGPGHETESFHGLHVEWHGRRDTPGVVVLHGWGSRGSVMRSLARAVGATHRVANVDLPGHGEAPTPAHALDVPAHARLVASLIRERFDGPVVILGHSNGGRIALFMASEDSMSSLIRALVLIAPSGVKAKRKLSFYVRKYIATALKAPFEVLPTRQREFGLDWLRHSLVWKALGSSDYRRLSGVMRDTFVRTVTFHLDDRLDGVRVPTLIFWGDQDADISRYQMSVLEHRIPDAGLVTLRGAGHYAHLDEPQTVLAATRHFLQDLQTGRGKA